MLFACSGIAVHCQVHFARFLTSASLVRAFNDLKREGHDGLKVGAANHHSLNLLVYVS